MNDLLVHEWWHPPTWLFHIFQIAFAWRVNTDSTYYEFQNKEVQHLFMLTHWGRVTHICVGNLTIIGPDNGLSPGRRQAIIWTNAGILLIRPLGTNFSEILIEIHTFSFKKMCFKLSSEKWRPFCLGLNVLIYLLYCRATPEFTLHFSFSVNYSRNPA